MLRTLNKYRSLGNKIKTVSKSVQLRHQHSQSLVGTNVEGMTTEQSSEDPQSEGQDKYGIDVKGLCRGHCFDCRFVVFFVFYLHLQF